MSSPSRGSVGVVDGGWIREAEGAWFEVDVGGNGCIGIDGVKMFVLHYLIETKTHPERNMVSRLTANLQADMLGNNQHNNNNHFSRRNQSLNSSAVSSPRRSPYAQPTLSNFHPPLYPVDPIEVQALLSFPGSNPSGSSQHPPRPCPSQVNPSRGGTEAPRVRRS